MSDMTLEKKIEATEAILLEVATSAAPGAVQVAWTGGKDSTVVLFIWRAVMAHGGRGSVRAINLDTGCKFTEIIAFRDRLAVEWDVDLTIARPNIVLKDYPLAVDPVSCCRELKVEPLQQAIRDQAATHLLTGIRRDEHPDRAGRKEFEVRTRPDHVMVNPILEWTEMDIWAFHSRFNLPFCELYERGYRSLGCQPCTTKPGEGAEERSGRDQAKERVMETLTSLGYF
ncbi:phosphoadenosine phosphosulfate reductase family protein [Pseudodesulfovibrio piezophilus]|uniref:Phosphoadenosine phosphosulfate reductase n=1 Tax=Pseudodesulfovibrio piezophilus (strain DSM 21447 / JCM 15486 / C1TLV30) TaxID=1322246 RepID=M1WQ24_PSEP2|nr:phosphoadenosine phosphosulfate reductase family protein [Pseudodesulfovibrio piezophilus]CCH48734.1 Phosphoadenosine phosphosulfate reductase [Pseudodesulfovibrio piezophilus C1TLV30]